MTLEFAHSGSIAIVDFHQKNGLDLHDEQIVDDGDDKEHKGRSGHNDIVSVSENFTEVKPDTTIIAKPPLTSFLVVLLNVALNVTSFLIVLPTSREYTESFNVNDRLAGLLVGLSPLINGSIQPLLVPIFHRFQLRHIFYVNCLLAIIGNALYSLGDCTNAYAMILAGRCVLGVSGGPVFGTTYVARATSVNIRTKFMEYVSVGISSGYILGPLLALVAEAIINATNLDDNHNQYLNSNTAPGWLMVFLFIVNLILFVVYFQEPATPVVDRRKEQQQKQQPHSDSSANVDGNEEHTSSSVLSGGDNDEEQGQVAQIPSNQQQPSISVSKPFQIAICYLFVAVAMINTGSFEIVLVFRGEKSWDFSIIEVAIMLAALNAVTCLVPFFVKIERWIKIDRKGIQFSFVGLVLASVWFFDYEKLAIPGDVTIFGVGGIMMLVSAQWAKSFLYGLVSKVPSPDHHQIVISFMATAYTFGRFLGTLVAPFLLDYNHAYGGFILAINAFCCTFVVLFYKQMRGPDEDVLQ